MTKRSIAKGAAAALLVLAVVIAIFSYTGMELTISISNAEAQRRIDAALEKRAAEDKTIQVESAAVTFDDDRIVIDAKLAGRVGSHRLVRADVHAEGKPEYRNGAFYFHPNALPRVANLKVDSFATTRTLLGARLEKEMEKHGWEDVAGAFKAEFQTWIEKNATEAAMIAFSRQPIYVLPKTVEGLTVLAVLERVRVTDGTLQITLTLAQMAYSIVAGVLFLLLGVATVTYLFFFPEWGVLMALA